MYNNINIRYYNIIIVIKNQCKCINISNETIKYELHKLLIFSNIITNKTSCIEELSTTLIS